MYLISIFLTFVSFVTLLVCLPFTQDYESFCKSSQSLKIDAFLNDSNGLSVFSRPYIFTNKLSPDGLQIDLFPDLDEDNKNKYLVEKIYNDFDMNSIIIGAFIDGNNHNDYYISFTRHTFNTNSKRGTELFITVSVFNSSKVHIMDTLSIAPSNQSLSRFPIIRVIAKSVEDTGQFIDLIQTFSYIDCKQNYCSLVFSKDSRKRMIVNMYDQNGLTEQPKFVDFDSKAMLIRNVIKNETLNIFNISVYLSFNKTFGLYEIISSDRLVQSIERMSIYRDNRVWFGCELNLCLNSQIDAITLSTEGKVLIFSGRFFWKWDKFRQFPKESDAFLLKPEFRHIDSAFLDPKKSKVFVIKGEDLIEFNDNNPTNIQKVSDVFPTFKGKVNAIDYDFNSDEIHLFSNDMSWNYLRQSDNKYKFQDKKSLKELDIPENLDAVFTDENLDQIYIKKNYQFWREYGVMTKYNIQRYFLCSDQFYMNLSNHEIKSLKDLESDLNLRQNIDFKQKQISIPEPMSSPLYITDTTEVSTDNSTVSYSGENPSKDSFWLILILVIFVIAFIAGICMGGVGYLCLQKISTEKRREELKEKLVESKTTLTSDN